MEFDKNLYEKAYEFFQSPNRDSLVSLIFNNIGEQDNLDFKEVWIEEQKLAEIILGIANVGNGAIIIGVKETKEKSYEPVGLSTLEDEAKMKPKLYKYIPNYLKFEIISFDFKGENYSKLKDKKFQIILIISEDYKLPYIWEKDTSKYTRGTILYRKDTKTLRADNNDVEKMILKRIKAEMQRSLQLKEHLEQMKLLYEYYSNTSFYNTYSNSVMLGLALFQKDYFNQKDSFEKFLSEMIEKKKNIIETILEIK